MYYNIRIQTLLNIAYEAIKKELKAIADAKKGSLAEYSEKGSLATDLFPESAAYVVQSPALLPRYLKQPVQGGKYFLVTPAAPIELGSEEAATYDAQRTFIDYDINDQDHVGANAKGMVYDRNGKPLQLVTGWQLLAMRAYAGILVDASGKQTLGIGVDHPALPLTVTFKDKTTQKDITQNVMIDTQFDIPKDGPASFKFFYNTQIDSYLVQITTQQSNYFIDLVSGYGYNVDGTPRYSESPVFTDDKGEVLLVGTDSYGLKKVAFKKQGATNYLIYNQMVSFGDFGTYSTVNENGQTVTRKLQASGSVTFSEYGDAQGSYFTLLSDAFGDPSSAPSLLEGETPSLQELRLAYAFLDKYGNLLPAPFYVVWDQVQSPNPSFDKNLAESPDNPKYLMKNTLVGKFTPEPALKFSLLNYVQTRQSASSLSGTYQADDLYNYPRGACNPDDTSCIKTPKVVGLIYSVAGNKQTMKEIFYQNQRCKLTAPGKDIYKASYKDEKGSTKTVNIKFESSQSKDSPLTAHWVSVTDGTKILDFVQESLVWDTLPLATGIEDPTNLNNKKRKVWKLNVSNFVTNAGLTKDFPGTHLNALATNLNANKPVQVGGLKQCTGIAQSIVDQVTLGLDSVKLDDAGYLYLPHAPNKLDKGAPVIKRFVYQFGKRPKKEAAELSFYDPALKDWSVDLNNGILYEPKSTFGAYPIGMALQPSALAELLGKFLQLYVDRDEQGNPKGLGIIQCTLPEQKRQLPHR